MFKSFNVHLHRRTTKYHKQPPVNGITFHISPSPDHHKVFVSYAVCSKKDQYCKKVGASVAKFADNVIEINKRNLPKHLATIAREAGATLLHESAYYYLWKYVV